MPAPVHREFSLLSTPDQQISLSEYRARPPVLVFYPAGDAQLLRGAETLGLDTGRSRQELEAPVHQPRVREDFIGGVRSGVNGTPTFFINEQRHDGSWDTDSLLAAVEAAGQHITR